MTGTEPDVEITEVADLAGLRALGALFDRLWERSTPAVPLELLRALVHAGNYAAAAWVGRRLAGGLVGFLGLHERRLALHSHILGVVPALQGRGVGAALKYHQRRWARDRDVHVVTWTFDPLVRRNARFNLRRLGVTVDAYLPDFYGHMADAFNVDAPTDRLLVSWPTVPGPPPADPEPGPPALAADPEGRPVVGELRGPRVSCATPEDIVRLRRADPALARAWSEAVRRTLGEALAQGYRVEGLDAAGAYVLSR